MSTIHRQLKMLQKGGKLTKMKFNNLYVVFQVLNRIANRNKTNLACMAIISDVNYHIHEKYHREITQPEFERLYAELEHQVIKDYHNTLTRLIYLIEQDGSIKQED